MAAATWCGGAGWRRLALGAGLVAAARGGAAQVPGTVQSQPDTSGARAGLEALARACRADGGATWGISLCGPVVVVDPRTRAAVANRPTPGRTFEARDGLFVGQLPDSVGVANTSVEWSGERWAMVTLPLPDDAFARADLLAHESFHRIQPRLGLWGSDPVSAHLDEWEGRLWLRLELHALAYALCTKGSAARGHILAALQFRAARRRMYPGADTLENALEMQEGLAEYTGVRLALALYPMGSQRLVHAMEEVERRPSYVRSFAYATGPAWGVLLDRYAPGWRKRVRRTRDLGHLLATAIGAPVDTLSDSALRATALPYDYVRVVAEEDAHATARRAQLATYHRQLVDGPVLTLRQSDLARAFNPNTLVALNTLGTVYPTGDFGALWGSLDVRGGGALVAPDFKWLRVAAPQDLSGTTLHGSDWTLELAPGYTIAPGPRPGDYEVVAPPP